jgi:hypothetical protein
LIQHQIDCIMANKGIGIDVYEVVIMLEKAWRIGVRALTIQNCWKHTGILSVFIGNGEEEEGMCLKELDDVTNLLHQLILLSSDIGISPTMNAHGFVHFEVNFDLNNPYQSTDEEIVQMLSSQHPIIDENEEVIIIDDVGLMHTRVYHFSCPGALFMHNS